MGGRLKTDRVGCPEGRLIAPPKAEVTLKKFTVREKFFKAFFLLYSSIIYYTKQDCQKSS